MTDHNINNNKMKDTKDQMLQVLGLFLFGLFLLVRQRHMDFSTCDDPWFCEQLNQMSLGEFLTFRYENWTSRLLIESLLVTVVRWNPWIWRVCNTGFILAIVYGMGRIALPEGKRKWGFVGALLLLLTPMDTLHSAGYAATSVNYIWPLGAGFLVMIPFADALQKKAGSRLAYVIGLLFSLLATNQEQMAAIIAGVSLCVMIHDLIVERKIYWYPSVIFVISLVQMIFVLICPGNKVRVQTEVIAHFADFTRISVWSKIQIGFLSETAYYFGIVERNVIMLPLFVCMLFVLWKRKNWIALSFQIPVWLVVLILGYGNNWLLRKEVAGTGISVFRNIQPMIFAYEYSMAQVWMEIIVYVFCCILIAAGVYVAAGRGKRGLIADLILIAGFLSRFIIGFSASVYVSGYRTAIFATLSIFLACMLLIEPFLPNVAYTKVEDTMR